ncbi:MAG: InlB B-repeat-containing protein, partial [Erysipelotrichaceae bacterium]|nr:InlB B-repeat-containing protein [Erysipelotrichaceae bacterium]
MLNYLKRHSNYVAVLIGFLVGIFVLKKYKDKFDFKNDRIIVLVSFLFSVFSVVSALMLATVEELISYGTFHVGSVATYGVYLICPLSVFIICRLMKMNVRKTFDAYALYAIPSLILLRINCIFSGCCTGRPFFKTGMLWPTREIEILFYLIVLYKFVTNEMKQLSRNGDMFPKLMLYYGAFRFVEEFFRSSFVSSVLPLTHIWSGVCIMIGFFMSKKRFSFSKTLICILTLVLSLFGSITSASVSAETKGSLPVVSDVSGNNETKAIAEAVWTIGSTSYTGLSAALSAAKNGDVIVLAADGTLSSGTYTIPGGVTLLIPYNADNTVSTSSNYAVVGNEYPDPTDYRTLTMESGANIIVNGKLNVGSAISARGQGGANTGTFSANGTPTGPHGKIVMNSGSNITVNNGAELFCFGYITGPDNTSGINDGTVTVKSGGIVREPLQIRDWRGGSFTKTIYDNRATWKCFPFSQYYVQNVEVPMTFESGSTEYVYSAVYVSDSVQKLDNVVFLGNNGLFSISSGSITRTYKSGDDTIHYDVNGNTSLNKISATITVGCTSISLDSSAYVLPITNNVVINVHSGTTTLTQDVQFLPGSEVHIDKGANLSISKNAYVFDNNEWGNFVFSELKSTVLTYTAATRGQRKALKDVIIDVNGTVNVNGNLYTTSNGADICSKERTGQVLLNSAPADGSLYEIVNGADGTAISITPAKLHNGSFSNTNDEYIETAGSVANDKYLYSNRLDRWNEKNHVSIVYDINDGSQKPQVSGQSVGINELATIAGNPFIREGFRFVEWNTKADGSGTSYSEGDSIKTTDEIVLYAIWSDSHEHIWCDPTWTWSRDYTQVTAHFVCSENESHIQDIAATVEHVHQDSTCMEEGFDKYTATVNLADKSYSDVKEEILPLADHTPSDPKEENRTEPTCTQDGGYDQVTYCTVCDNELSRIHHMLPATGHTAGETVMENVHEPTCTTEGSHEEVAYCISCGIELSRKEVSDPALGHLWKYVDYTVNEDYTEVIFNYVCEHDGSHKVSVKGVITVTDHIEPTCTTEGSFLVSVSIDKDTAPDGESRSDGKTVKIPALGHTLELLKGKDATCVLTGIKECYECSTCHHKFLDAEGKDPVEKEEDLIIEALGHDYGEWKQINAPTCTENGVEERECSRCHEKETRSIEASGHKAGEAVKENIV